MRKMTEGRLTAFLNTQLECGGVVPDVLHNEAEVLLTLELIPQLSDEELLEAYVEMCVAMEE